MTLENISAELSCTDYRKSSNHSTGKIEHIAASDLMSEVLVAEEENLLLITALNTEQTVRTANIVDALGILMVNDKKPQPGMIRLAEEFDLSIISTSRSMYETCAAVHSLLNRTDD